MKVDELIAKLERVRRTSRGWIARCPAHEDNNPSLSVSEGLRGILVRCWAGCTLDQVTEALGIRTADLFFDASVRQGRQPFRKPPKIDRVSLAFYFELAALDRRLRAERIVEAGKKLNVASLTDAELDRAFSAAAQAVADRERAELYEGVADGLRLRAFVEGENERHKRVA